MEGLQYYWKRKAEQSSGFRVGPPITVDKEEFAKLFGISMDDDDGTTVFVNIPLPLDPMERLREFEEPIQRALDAESAGKIVGGGSMIHESCTIDIRLTDLDKGIAILKTILRELDAPPETYIEYQESRRVSIS